MEGVCTRALTPREAAHQAQNAQKSRAPLLDSQAGAAASPPT
jgi:hypothetical protein